MTYYSKASCHIKEELNDNGNGSCLTFRECRGERSCVNNKCIGEDNCNKYIIKIRKTHKFLKSKKGRKMSKIIDLE